MLLVPVEIFLCAIQTLKNLADLYSVYDQYLIVVQCIIIIYYCLCKFIYAEPKNEINTIDISVNGDYLVSGGKDATVRLYNAETAKVNNINYLEICDLYYNY